jgi:hypothetical protein
MLDPKQQELLKPVKSRLNFFCAEMAKSSVPDKSELGASEIFFTAVPATGKVTFLGIQVRNRVYNLLGPGVKNPKLLNCANPFGSPFGSSQAAVFLDGEHFSFGECTERNGTHANFVLKDNSTRSGVPLALVAPARDLLGSPDLAVNATRDLPLAARPLLRDLRSLAKRCVRDMFAGRVLHEAASAVEASGLAGADLSQAATRMQHAAQRMEKLRHLGETCSHAKGKMPDAELRRLTGDLRLFACRCELAHAAARRDLLRSDDRAFYQQLAELEEQGEEEQREAAARCLDALAEARPDLTRSMRARGAGLDQHRLSAVLFQEVARACADAHSDNGSLQLLSKLARQREPRAQVWQQALEHAGTHSSLQVPAACAASVRRLVDKIKDLSCRKHYQTYLRSDASDSSSDSTSGLAHEVALKLQSSSDGVSDELAGCLLSDARLSPRLQQRLRREHPNLETSDARAAIKEEKQATQERLAKEKAALRSACSSRAPAPGLELLLEEDASVAKVFDGVTTASRALVTEVLDESEQERQERLSCLKQVRAFALVVERDLCRVRLMEKLHSAGSDAQLSALFATRVHDQQLQGDRTDAMCLTRIQPREAAVKSLLERPSSRSCNSAETASLVEAFCVQARALYIPVNYLDFLSILTLASVPAWGHLPQTWLETRKRTLTQAGVTPTCLQQERVIKTHREGARQKLTAAVASVVGALSRRTSVSDLASCACSSDRVGSLEQRKRSLADTFWYWHLGAQLIGAGDVSSIFQARQLMTAAVLQSETNRVSWWGDVSLLPAGDRTLWRTIWNAYLAQMYGGCLNSFRMRIEEQTADSVCRLSLLDTFFFVVCLDLVDVSKASSQELDHVLRRAVGDARGVAKDAAAGLLAVAVAAGLAGVQAQAAQIGLVALGGAYATIFAKEALKRYAGSSFAQKYAGASAKEGLLQATHERLYDSVFVFKTDAVHSLLRKLCARAFEQSATPARPSSRRYQVSTGAAVSLEPPGFFPLAPPGAQDPDAACNEGVC